MSIDEQHVALPTLYGAPAYARPAAAVTPKERPFDPDELPLEAVQTEEEREFTATLPSRAYAPGGVALGTDGAPTSETSTGSTGRSLRIREIAGRVLRI